jgi:hypothetical protein
MSETHELAEKITESGEHAEHGHVSDATFRRRVGVLIGALACALAITSVSGSNAMKRTLIANIEASDTYSFYQAKVIRQQVLRGANDDLDTTLLTHPELSPDDVAKIRARQDGYKKDITHWDSSPETGDGKKELLEKAHRAEERRNHASEQNEWFEIAEALLQISVVIASTSVLMASRPLLIFCLVFAGLGLACAVNGYGSFVELPFGGG